MRRLPLALALAAVLAQVAHPLLSGHALTAATIAAVVLFCAASVTSAAATHGLRAALALAAVGGVGGVVAEAVGVATGVPFGDYAYAGTLGPQVLGVPLLVPLAWTMMAWPCLLAGRTVAARWSRPALAVPLAAWALAAWDLFLDPQMVAAGHWAWEHPEPSLPGSPGVPLTNYAGWLLVALVMQALLHALVPRRTADPGGAGTARGASLGAGAPALLLGWTWLGSTLANLAFFGRPAVAAWGFAAMGLVVGPYLLLLVRSRAAALPAEAPARSRAPAL
ncbi:carotenoid biosynthesis protein [Quadrisphaera sp. DSM 44207]|uniref:carotenoid biosynthesis protein n=1 Tax=Quadrisphaera sp. DSM 44207 TaxID=1881057 RepID=UPI00087F7AB2|nr:carotenoid biosynthesis protein [Quadrisphaera sp. DSM 44207]SDQ78914.1 putative membrane protein [Quadrisphaera sp. DSM 44207]